MTRLLSHSHGRRGRAGTPGRPSREQRRASCAGSAEFDRIITRTSPGFNASLPAVLTRLIIARVMSLRRVHLSQLRPGTVALPEGEAHHVRDVLRMQTGDTVQVFDDAGALADAKLVVVGPRGVEVSIGEVWQSSG